MKVLGRQRVLGEFIKAHHAPSYPLFVGVLKVQSDSLDIAYMRHWANELGLEDLLGRALRDAGQ